MLHAAVCAGADAVYLGMGDFNARRNADNFNASTFREACEYAHLRGVRVYVALNTIVLPSEIKSAVEAAKMCDRSGADGFIVADIGLACAVKTALPNVCIHISTQMNVHSVDGLLACAAMGAMRVTLARELSLAEISSICDVAHKLDIEIETFLHGALCFCYSGQCLMSSMIGGRSANRGLCAQPCRLPYELVDEEGRQVSMVPGFHLLSPKDLCGLDDLDALIGCGVSSLKIEGRMKSPEYVYTTVSVYRREIDRICDEADGTEHEPNADAKQDLESVFSRGFTSGYLDGDRSNAIMGYGRPNNRGQFAGRIKRVQKSSILIDSRLDIVSGDVLQVWTKRGNITINVEGVSEGAGDEQRIDFVLATDPSQTKATIQAGDRVFRVRSKEAEFSDDASEPAIPVKCDVELIVGKPLKVEFEIDRDADDPISQLIAQRLLAECSEGAFPVGSYLGDMVEPARTKPVTAEDVVEHIGRMGGSGFVLTNINVALDGNPGIGFSQLHRARQHALKNLEEALLHAHESPQAKIEDTASWLKGYESSCASFDDPKRRRSSECAIYVLVTNPDCARAAKRAGADSIYVSAYDYKRGTSSMQGCVEDVTRQAGYPKGCIISIPSILHDDVEETQGNKNDPWELAKAGAPLLVGSIGSLYHASDLGAVPQVASTLSIANPESVKVASAAGADLVWLSPELELKQIEQITRDNCTAVELGLCVNGYQELMVSEHCVLMSMGECSQDCDGCPRRRKRHFLKDRKGYEFPVYTDDSGRSHIMNSVEYDVMHAIKDLQHAGIYTYMVDATLMTPEECAQRVGKLSKAIQLAASGKSLDKEQGKTTGHLFREVL